MASNAGLGEGGRAWWTQPQHFCKPLVFYVDAEQEDRVFGARDRHGDSQLRRLEEHSHTLIQLEAWATPDGHTRVTVVGPAGARRWLLSLVRSLGSGEPGARTRDLAMLRLVHSRPLHSEDLASTPWEVPLPADLALAIILSRPGSLLIPGVLLLLWIGWMFWNLRFPAAVSRAQLPRGRAGTQREARSESLAPGSSSDSCGTECVARSRSVGERPEVRDNNTENISY